MPDTLQNYLNFITETAYLAGRLTLGFFQTGIKPDFKSDNTPVTLADRQAEAFIRQRIEQRFPHHSILGEEEGEKAQEGADHMWIIDPIDGTKAFTRGVPLYAVLVALEIEGHVQAGAAYFPALEEMVAAANGLGCWWNGRLARVSEVKSLDQGAISFTDIGNFNKYQRMRELERLAGRAYFRAGWGDAYGYALVATGRIELMLDPVMSVWDCGPFPTILKEAGGYFGDWQGNPTIYAGEGLATSQALLPEVLALIRGE